MDFSPYLRSLPLTAFPLKTVSDLRAAEMFFFKHFSNLNFFIYEDSQYRLGFFPHVDKMDWINAGLFNAKKIATRSAGALEWDTVRFHEISNEVECVLNDGFYIWADLDDYYMPGRCNTGLYHNIHSNLITHFRKVNDCFGVWGFRWHSNKKVFTLNTIEVRRMELYKSIRGVWLERGDGAEGVMIKPERLDCQLIALKQDPNIYFEFDWSLILENFSLNLSSCDSLMYPLLFSSEDYISIQKTKYAYRALASGAKIYTCIAGALRNIHPDAKMTFSQLVWSHLVDYARLTIAKLQRATAEGVQIHPLVLAQAHLVYKKSYFLSLTASNINFSDEKRKLLLADEVESIGDLQVDLWNLLLAG